MSPFQSSPLNKLYCVKCRHLMGLVPIVARSCRAKYCTLPRVYSEFCSRDHAFLFYTGFFDNVHASATLHLDAALDISKGDYKATCKYLDKQIAASYETSEKHRALQDAVRKQQETGLCQYVSRRSGLVCANEARSCSLHTNWYIIASNRLNLECQLEPRTQPDPAWLRHRINDPAKISIYDDSMNDSHKISICRVPYVWDPNDDDYNLFGDPQPFLARHYKTANLSKKR